jgi:hypothetical protein
MKKVLSVFFCLVALATGCAAQNNVQVGPVVTVAKKVFLEFNKDSTEVKVHGKLLGEMSDDPEAFVTNKQYKEAKGYGRLYVIRFNDSNLGALPMTGLMYVYTGKGGDRFLLPSPKEAEGFKVVIVNKGGGDLNVGKYRDIDGKEVSVLVPRRVIEIVSDGEEWMTVR